MAVISRVSLLCGVRLFSVLRSSCALRVSARYHVVVAHEVVVVVAHLLVVVRRRVHLDASSALFLLLDGGTLPAMTETVGALHRKHADAEDGFLYLKFARENAFGAWGSAR